MPEQTMPRLLSACSISCVCLSFSLTDGAYVPTKKGAMVCALCFVPDTTVSVQGKQGVITQSFAYAMSTLALTQAELTAANRYPT